MGFTPAAEGIPPSFNAASGFGGYKLSSADRRRILQITPGGFVFSQLAPYQNGDIFRQRFWPIWEQFRSETKPARVQRIGLRCVNRINIPLPMSDFDDYFQTFLRLGPKVPQGIADLFLRFVLPDPNIPRQAATVILASEPRVRLKQKRCLFCSTLMHFDSLIWYRTIPSWGAYWIACGNIAINSFREFDTACLGTLPISYRLPHAGIPGILEINYERCRQTINLFWDCHSCVQHDE